MFKVSLDNILLNDEPLGVDNFEAQITRDFKRRDIITKFPLPLTFIGDGYRYIKKQQKDKGYCDDIDFKAEILCGGTVTRTLLGKLYITAVKFDLEKCYADVEIIDDNFAARVNNNRSVEVNLGAWNTKSKDFLQGATKLSLNLFKPSTGAFDDGIGSAGFTNLGFRISYDWKVAMEHLLSYISDKAISGVKSTWYDGLPDGQRWAVVSGRELRQGASVDEKPNITFDDLFGEMAKLYNLYMSIETDSNGDYFVRVEQEAYFYNATSLFTLEKIKTVKESFLQTQLFSNLVFGDRNAAKEFVPGVDEIGYIRFFNHTKEQYHTDNQCNIDTPLDLSVSGVAIDHNLITKALYDASESNDEKTFFIQYNHTDDKASNGDPFNDGSKVYNPAVLNNEVAERYDLQGFVAKHLGDNDDTFSATFINQYVITHTHPPLNVTTLVNPFPFVSEQADPNNNYDPFTYRYTCPTSGLYSFRVSMFWSVDCIATSAVQTIAQVGIEHYDSGNTLIGTHVANGNPVNGLALPPNYQELHFFQTIYMAASDYVQSRFTVLSTITANVLGSFDVVIKAQPTTSVFLCANTFDGGGVYQEKIQDDYKVSIFEFDKYLNGEQINLMLDNPHRPITFNMDGKNNIKGWPMENNMKFLNGNSSFKLINAPNDIN